MRAARLVSRRKIDFLEIPDPDPIVDEEVKAKATEVWIEENINTFKEARE